MCEKEREVKEGRKIYCRQKTFVLLLKFLMFLLEIFMFLCFVLVCSCSAVLTQLLLKSLFFCYFIMDLNNYTSVFFFVNVSRAEVIIHIELIILLTVLVSFERWYRCLTTRTCLKAMTPVRFVHLHKWAHQICCISGRWFVHQIA